METNMTASKQEPLPWRYVRQKRSYDPFHPLFQEGNEERELFFKQLAVEFVPTEGPVSQNVGQFRCLWDNCGKWFDSTSAYEAHYESLHRHVCSQCMLVLPSHRYLDLHLLEIHDTLFKVMADKQPMYECYLESCGQKFATPKLRAKHMVDMHKFPPQIASQAFLRRKRKPKKPTKPLAQSQGDNQQPKGNDQQQAQAQTAPENLGTMGTPSAPHPSQGDSMDIEQLTQSMRTMRIPAEITFGGRGKAGRFRPRTQSSYQAPRRPPKPKPVGPDVQNAAKQKNENGVKQKLTKDKDVEMACGDGGDGGEGMLLDGDVQRKNAGNRKRHQKKKMVQGEGEGEKGERGEGVAAKEGADSDVMQI